MNHRTKNDVWQEQIHGIGQRSRKIMQSILRGDADNPLQGIRFVLALGFSYRQLLWDFFRLLGKDDPGKAAIQAFHKDIKRLARFAHAALRKQQAPLLFILPDDDMRFRNAAWRENTAHRIVLQSYLLLSHHLTHFATTIPFESRDKQQILFCVDLLLETLCPNNCLLTNPEAMRYTRQQKGLNVLKGMHYFLEDLQRWKGHINLTKTNLKSFTVGKNLAVTKGKVIYRNAIMELIFYQPTTSKQCITPILLMTSWINKFYILDLREKNSLIRWLSNQGMAVFAISWINPDATHKDLGLEAFMEQGVIQAISTIQSTLDCQKVHALGYCLGGTLLAITAAYMQASKQNHLASLSFIATMTDFAEGGGIGNLMRPAQLAVYEKTLAKNHVWDGHKMQIGFNLTNSNHFIWPFMQRRYLMGKTNVAIDSIHWGLDLANTTEALYRFYTNDLHRDNALATPGALSVNGVPIDLSCIKAPVCCIAFDEDNISPWQTVYQLAQTQQGYFILGSGNHITGLITPEKHARSYHRAGQASKIHAINWLNQQPSEQGSWWRPWYQWMRKIDQTQTDYTGHYHKIYAIVAAPGSYVTPHNKESGTRKNNKGH